MPGQTDSLQALIHLLLTPKNRSELEIISQSYSSQMTKFSSSLLISSQVITAFEGVLVEILKSIEDHEQKQSFFSQVTLALTAAATKLAFTELSAKLEAIKKLYTIKHQLDQANIVLNEEAAAAVNDILQSPFVATIQAITIEKITKKLQDQKERFAPFGDLLVKQNELKKLYPSVQFPDIQALVNSTYAKDYTPDKIQARTVVQSSRERIQTITEKTNRLYNLAQKVRKKQGSSIEKIVIELAEQLSKIPILDSKYIPTSDPALLSIEQKLSEVEGLEKKIASLQNEIKKLSADKRVLFNRLLEQQEQKINSIADILAAQTGITDLIPKVNAALEAQNILTALQESANKQVKALGREPGKVLGDSPIHAQRSFKEVVGSIVSSIKDDGQKQAFLSAVTNVLSGIQTSKAKQAKKAIVLTPMEEFTALAKKLQAIKKIYEVTEDLGAVGINLDRLLGQQKETAQKTLQLSATPEELQSITETLETQQKRFAPFRELLVKQNELKQLYPSIEFPDIQTLVDRKYASDDQAQAVIDSNKERISVIAAQTNKLCQLTKEVNKKPDSPIKELIAELAGQLSKIPIIDDQASEDDTPIKTSADAEDEVSEDQVSCITQSLNEVRELESRIENLQTKIGNLSDNKQSFFNRLLRKQMQAIGTIDIGGIRGILDELQNIDDLIDNVKKLNNDPVNTLIDSFSQDDLADQDDVTLRLQRQRLDDAEEFIGEIISVQNEIEQLTEQLELLKNSADDQELLNKIRSLIAEQQGSLSQVKNSSRLTTIRSGLQEIRKLLNPKILQQLATAYARLAYVTDAVNQGICEGRFVRLQDMGRAIRAGQEEDKRDIWTIFDIALQEAKKQNRQVEFDRHGKSVITVRVGGRVFQVALKKATDKLGKTIPNTYDVSELRQYIGEKGTPLTLGANILKSDIRVKKTKNSLIASDKETGTEIVRGQHVSHGHQADGMLRIFGKQLKGGEISPVSGDETVAKNSKLIVAGTGAGKTGIIATAAMVYGRGIFATQSSVADNLVNDVNKFITTAGVAEKFVDAADGKKLSRAEFAEILRTKPYIVMTHDQLIKYADELNALTGQRIFIDEVHSIVPKNYETAGSYVDPAKQEQKSKLEKILQTNIVVGATATPTNEVEELLGKAIYELSLHDAQKDKTVRATRPKYQPTAKESLAAQAVTSLLTRSDTVKEGEVGCIYTKGKPDPTKNTVHSANAQGIIFSDDAETAEKIHELLSKISGKCDDRDPLCQKMQEAKKTQKSVIEANMQINIILSLGVPNQTELALQKMVRHGNFDALRGIYQKSITEYYKDQRTKDTQLKDFENKLVLINDRVIRELAGINDFQVLFYGNEDFRALFLAYKEMLQTSLKDNPALIREKLSEFRSYFTEPYNYSGAAARYIEAFSSLTIDIKTEFLSRLKKQATQAAYGSAEASSILLQISTNLESMSDDVTGSIARQLQISFGKKTIHDLKLTNSAVLSKNNEKRYEEFKKKFPDLCRQYLAAVRKNHLHNGKDAQNKAVQQAELGIQQLISAGDGKAIAVIRQKFMEEKKKSYEIDMKYEHEKQEDPELASYYDGVTRYFDASLELEAAKIEKSPREKLKTAAEQTAEAKMGDIVSKLFGESSISVLLLSPPTDQANVKKVKLLLAKGLANYAVSTGLLGTGYSNPNLIDLVILQEHPLDEALPPPWGNLVSEYFQEAGRTVRGPDKLSFLEFIADQSIPEELRHLKLDQVFGANTLNDYKKKLGEVDEYCAINAARIKVFYDKLQSLKAAIDASLEGREQPKAVKNLLEVCEFAIARKVIVIKKQIEAYTQGPYDQIEAQIKEVGNVIENLKEELKHNLGQQAVDSAGIKNILIDLVDAHAGLQKQLDEKRDQVSSENVENSRVKAILEKQASELTEIEQQIKQHCDAITNALAKPERKSGELLETARQMRDLRESLYGALEQRHQDLQAIKPQGLAKKTQDALTATRARIKKDQSNHLHDMADQIEALRNRAAKACKILH